ncbi:hypothetical protein CYMTET_5709 [Cymbomonas tetramitiformis]|uniref:Uncharacterized protein n=1 Tax=Cymbomonas tetramitiformis TaxID=36881 RepID=A0AAE0GYX3_9CHLO|nr:hypothetical protein CYMTET_5709 [Cymbomonas tetramitiformis]
MRKDIDSENCVVKKRRLAEARTCDKTFTKRRRQQEARTADRKWINDIVEAPVYRPSVEEFQNPFAYIRKIRDEGASEYGICKIVPPCTPSVPGAVVLRKERMGFTFSTRLQQLRQHRWKTNDQVNFNFSGKSYSVEEYERLANDFLERKFMTTGSLPVSFVEEEYWQAMNDDTPTKVEYASDIEGSAFSSTADDPLTQSKWNLKHLAKADDSTFLRLFTGEIPGVTEPMLYLGMLYSTFAWHVEDHYLYSINYHHFGASKTWYGVPSSGAHAFEKIVVDKVYGPAFGKDQPNVHNFGLKTLLGKTTMFSPKLLHQHGVPVCRAVQNPGDFIVTFPQAYHAGFSHGFNCGEAVNFATTDWLTFGVQALERYRSLQWLPVIPHEKLLCQEAMELIEKDEATPSGERKPANVTATEIKVAFLLMMREQHRRRTKFISTGNALSVMPPFSSCMPCSVCKHLCFLDIVNCSCSEPVCLRDALENPCSCGNVIGHHRREVNDYEQVASMLDSDPAVVMTMKRLGEPVDFHWKPLPEGLEEVVPRRAQEYPIKEGGFVGGPKVGGPSDSAEAGINRNRKRRLVRLGDVGKAVKEMETQVILEDKPPKATRNRASARSGIKQSHHSREDHATNKKARPGCDAMNNRDRPLPLLEDTSIAVENLACRRRLFLPDPDGQAVVFGRDVVHAVGLNKALSSDVIQTWFMELKLNTNRAFCEGVSTSSPFGCYVLSEEHCRLVGQIISEDKRRRMELFLEDVWPTSSAVPKATKSVEQPAEAAGVLDDSPGVSRTPNSAAEAYEPSGSPAETKKAVEQSIEASELMGAAARNAQTGHPSTSVTEDATTDDIPFSDPAGHVEPTKWQQSSSSMADPQLKAPVRRNAMTMGAINCHEMPAVEAFIEDGNAEMLAVLQLRKLCRVPKVVAAVIANLLLN